MPRGRKPRYSFNDVEQRIIDRMKQRGKLEKDVLKEKLTSPVIYVADKNFTYATFSTENTIFVGAAKRNPNDEYNPVVGEQLAFTRAVSKGRE
jgi:hypothetical protein